MAQGVGLGLDLTKIDQQLIKLNGQFDQLIKKGAQFKNVWDASFKNMGEGGLKAFAQELANLKKNVVDFGKHKVGVKWDSASLQKYIDDVQRLILVIKQVQKETKGKKDIKGVNITGLKKEVKDAQEMLRLAKHREKEEKDIQTRIANARAQAKKREEDLDKQAYQTWLAQKHKEEKEQKRIEEAKTRATQQAIARQNAEYKKQEEIVRQAHLASQRAKENSAQRSRVIDESTYAMYARMFDDISRREQQYIQERHARNEQQKKDKLNQLSAEIKAHQEYQQRVAALEKARAQKQLEIEERRRKRQQFLDNARGDSSKGAINYYNRLYSDKGVKSINNMNRAIQMMQEAQRKLNLNTEDGKKKYDELAKNIKRVQDELNKTTKASENLQKKSSSLLNTNDQLARKLALVFSVSQIQGYINKMIAVRKEFELQNKSLQIILQNKDAADKLWQQTLDLAVKSPFRIGELIKYTKQLAAYRIEEDKLHDTTKRLADVSAGLGVDMQRLILAYGQIRAANFLRGTELRQLTEAGIPMLDELAKYFTEIEGRVVSTGDVFARISKRMVLFTDVEKVFQRMTNKGGVFYKMQEQQADTLHGKISNLYDTVDIMLNNIGKSHDGILKNAVSLVSQLIKNWQDLAPYIKAAGYSFLTYFGVKQLINIAKGFKMLWSVMAANPILVTIGILATLAVTIYQVATAQDKLNQSMQEVDYDVIRDLEQSIALYHELADSINDVTKSNEERNESLRDLQSKFKDILDDQLLELEYVEQLGGNYREAEAALLDYYNAKARALKRDKIESQFADELEGTDIPELVSSIRDGIDEKENITDEYKIKLRAGVAGVVNSLVEDVKSGKIKADLGEFYTEINKRLSQYAGVDFALPTVLDDYTSNTPSSILEDIKDIVRTLKRYEESFNLIKGLPYGTYDQEKAGEMINAEKKNVETAVKSFKKAAGLYEKYVTAVPTLRKSVEEQRKEIEQDVQKILKDLPQSMNAYSVYLEQVFSNLKTNADKGLFHFKAALQTIESELYAKRDEEGNLTDGLAKIAFDNVKLDEKANAAAIRMVDNFQETLDEQSKKLETSDFQEALIEGAEKIAEKFNVSTDVFSKFVPTAKESLSSIRTLLESEIENIELRIKEFQNSLKVGMFVLSEKALNETKEQIEYLVKVLPALKEFQTFLGGPKKTKKGANKDWMSELIKGIKEAHKEYISLNKTLDETESKQIALAKYADVVAVSAKNAGISGVSLGNLNFTTEQGTIDALEMLRDKLPEGAKQARLNIEKALADIRGELRITTKKDDDKALMDSIESLFSNYEISLELDELNIPADLQKQIFGVGHMSLKDLRQSLEEHKSLFVGKDMEGEYDKFLKKLEDMEDKALHERAKKYSKYLAKSMSETVKFKLAEQRAIAEIDSLNVSDDVKESMRQGVRQETQKNIEKRQWADFKETDLYIEMFEDLDAVSYRTLKRMKEELTKMRDSLKNLDPSELKEIVSQIEKIDKEMMDKKPLEGFTSNVWNYFKNVKKYKEAEKETFDAQEYYNSAKTNIDNLQLEIEEAKTNGDYERVESLEQELVYAKSLLDIYKKQLKIATAKKNEAKESVNTTKEQIQKVGSYISEAANALPQLMGNLQSMGVNVSDSTRDTIESISEIAGGVGSAIQGFASGNYIQGVMGAMQAIGGVFKIGDKKREREIQDEIKNVERLQHAYEKLERAIENAYSVNTLQASMDLAESNIKEQIESTEKMIKAEEDKKDTDHERIEEWEREIESMKEQLEELENQRVESLGGIGGEEEYKSAAESFVDAWLSAYQETGDGLRGLEEEFDEVMRNLIKKQITLRAAQGYLEPLFKQIDKAVGRDSDIMLSAEEVVSNLQNMEGNIDSTMSDLNDMLSYLAQQYDIGDWIEGSSNLSGLQKGIQGVTEDTADIIASYLNSIRFFVAEKHSMLSQITDAFTNTDAPNPMLMELRIQTDLVRSINDMFGSVIGRGDSTHTGAYLKVKM